MAAPSGARRVLLSPLGIALIALAVRLVFVLSMGGRTYFGDTQEYEASALRLLHGAPLDGSSPRALLFPALMALGFALGGEQNYMAVRLLQLLLGSGTVLLVVQLGRRMGGAGIGALAGLLAAFSPTLVFVTGMLYPTALYTLVLLAATLVSAAMAEAPRWQRGVLLGGLFTLGWLTDQAFLAPAAALLGWLILQVRRGGPRLAGATALALVTMLAIAGPYVRSQRGAFSGESVFMKKAQFVLHYARTDPQLGRGRAVELPPNARFEPLAPGQFLRRELALVRTQPAAYAHDVAFEFLHFFQPLPDRIQTANRYSRPLVLWIGAIYFTPVLLLALLGLWRGRARARGRGQLLLVVCATAGFYALFFTQTRYRIPVEPLMIVLAALGAQVMWPGLVAALGPRGEPAARPADAAP